MKAKWEEGKIWNNFQYLKLKGGGSTKIKGDTRKGTGHFQKIQTALG